MTTMIKITAESHAEIKEALDRTQGRRTSFVMVPEDVFAYASKAEKHLEALGIPQKNRPGAKASFSVKGPQAKSYKYSASVTSVDMVRRGKEWYLTIACTSSVSPCSKARREMMLTDEQKEIATREATKRFSYVQ